MQGISGTQCGAGPLPSAGTKETEQAGTRQPSQLSPFLVLAEPSEDLSPHPTGINKREQDGGNREQNKQG